MARVGVPTPTEHDSGSRARIATPFVAQVVQPESLQQLGVLRYEVVIY